MIYKIFKLKLALKYSKLHETYSFVDNFSIFNLHQNILIEIRSLVISTEFEFSPNIILLFI